MESISITPAELGIPETIPLPKRSDWRIGIVGFGNVSRNAHMPSYREVGWSIVAAVDPSADARKAAEEEFGIPRTYADYRDLIADPEVEIIDLCTHPDIREEVILAAAKVGKHVITEKPLAETIEECERMIEIADKAGTKLAVHQNYRWYKMCFYAHHVINHGYIGEPFFAGIEIIGRQDIDLARHPFYATCDNFLTVQWDNHLADLFRYWLGRDAVRIFARTERPKGQNFRSDNLLMVISEFGDGVTGHMLHHELLHSCLGGNRCRIDGDKGSLAFDLSDHLELESELLGKGTRTLDTSGIAFPGSWAGTMGDLLISIEEDREPLVSARRNLPTVRTILAEDQSVRSGGGWVALA